MKHLFYTPLVLIASLGLFPSLCEGEVSFSKNPSRSFTSVVDRQSTQVQIQSAYEDKMGNQLVRLTREQDGITRKVLVWGVSGQFWEVPVLQESLRADGSGRPMHRILFPADESRKDIGILLMTPDRVSISCSSGRGDLKSVEDDGLAGLTTNLSESRRIQNQENRFNPRWWLKYLSRKDGKFTTQSIYIEEDRLRPDRVRVFAGTSRLSRVSVTRYFRDEYRESTELLLSSGLKISIPDNFRRSATLRKGEKNQFQARQYNASDVEKHWLDHGKSSTYTLRSPCEVATQSLALRAEKGNPVR